MMNAALIKAYQAYMPGISFDFKDDMLVIEKISEHAQNTRNDERPNYFLMFDSLSSQ